MDAFMMIAGTQMSILAPNGYSVAILWDLWLLTGYMAWYPVSSRLAPVQISSIRLYPANTTMDIWYPAQHRRKTSGESLPVAQF